MSFKWILIGVAAGGGLRYLQARKFMQSHNTADDYVKNRVTRGVVEGGLAGLALGFVLR